MLLYFAIAGIVLGEETVRWDKSDTAPTLRVLMVLRAASGINEPSTEFTLKIGIALAVATLRHRPINRSVSGISTTIRVGATRLSVSS
jgi:hypothetical protein